MIFFATLISSGLITRLLVIHGARLSRLDIPNERSSHSIPTPRGGGIAIVTVTVAALVGCYLRNLMDGRDAIAIAAGSLIVALVGYLDDRGTTTAARWRLLGHTLGVWKAWWS